MKYGVFSAVLAGFSFVFGVSMVSQTVDPLLGMLPVLLIAGLFGAAFDKEDQ